MVNERYNCFCESIENNFKHVNLSVVGFRLRSRLQVGWLAHYKHFSTELNFKTTAPNCIFVNVF